MRDNLRDLLVYYLGVHGLPLAILLIVSVIIYIMAAAQ